jgi:hypothetical protein
MNNFTRIAGNPAEIRTENLPSARLQRYYCACPLNSLRHEDVISGGCLFFVLRFPQKYQHYGH